MIVTSFRKTIILYIYNNIFYTLTSLLQSLKSQFFLPVILSHKR